MLIVQVIYSVNGVSGCCTTFSEQQGIVALYTGEPVAEKIRQEIEARLPAVYSTVELIFHDSPLPITENGMCIQYVKCK